VALFPIDTVIVEVEPVYAGFVGLAEIVPVVEVGR
jgi:hypothetical protein